MGGLWTVPYVAAYCASKHALEAIAEGLKTELEPFGIKIATCNPGVLVQDLMTAEWILYSAGTILM